MSTDPRSRPVAASAPAAQEAVRERSVANEPLGSGSFLDAVMESTLGRPPVAGRPPQSLRLDAFLAEQNTAKAIDLWIGAPEKLKFKLNRQSLARKLSRDIAAIDRLMGKQVDAILHHPRFQQLEASWRGLEYLVNQVATAEDVADEDAVDLKIKIRVLSVTKKELFRDLDRAIEFDQSFLFKSVYEEEFGIAGGEPFGALIGDYQFTGHLDDVTMLSKLSGVAAAAFCPFIGAAAPELLGLDRFTTLERPVRLASTFEQPEFLKWRALRDREDSRFVGLTMPRTLMRLPHQNDGTHSFGFVYHEDVTGPQHDKYLWGSASYAFAGVLIRAFSECGWFADIRGFEQGHVGGGLVADLPVHSFATDRSGVAMKTSTDVAIHEFQERELSAAGFIPLCPTRDGEYSVFYTNQSMQKPKVYDETVATTNARISAMLQYIMCASRFAHHLKVLGRTKLGSFQTERELETFLNDWITRYVAADEKAAPAIKARYPLREAGVQVTPIPAKPGSYRMVVHMLPHFQLDELTASLKLVTQLSTPPR